MIHIPPVQSPFLKSNSAIQRMVFPAASDSVELKHRPTHVIRFGKKLGVVPPEVLDAMARKASLLKLLMEDPKLDDAPTTRKLLEGLDTRKKTFAEALEERDHAAVAATGAELQALLDVNKLLKPCYVNEKPDLIAQSLEDLYIRLTQIGEKLSLGPSLEDYKLLITLSRIQILCIQILVSMAVYGAGYTALPALEDTLIPSLPQFKRSDLLGLYEKTAYNLCSQGTSILIEDEGIDRLKPLQQQLATETNGLDKAVEDRLTDHISEQITDLTNQLIQNQKKRKAGQPFPKESFEAYDYLVFLLTEIMYLPYPGLLPPLMTCLLQCLEARLEELSPRKGKGHPIEYLAGAVLEHFARTDKTVQANLDNSPALRHYLETKVFPKNPKRKAWGQFIKQEGKGTLMQWACHANDDLFIPALGEWLTESKDPVTNLKIATILFQLANQYRLRRNKMQQQLSKVGKKHHSTKHLRQYQRLNNLSEAYKNRFLKVQEILTDQNPKIEAALTILTPQIQDQPESLNLFGLSPFKIAILLGKNSPILEQLLPFDPDDTELEPLMDRNTLPPFPVITASGSDQQIEALWLQHPGALVLKRFTV